MAFAPGDRVHVAMLGTGVVREVRNGGRYLVELKGRSVVVDLRQLAPAEGNRHREKPVAPARVDAPHPAMSPRSIDLHGMTPIDAIEALDVFLNAALLEAAREVRIIHGRSGGRLRGAVHARLEQMPAVHGYSIDPRNAGVTIVRF